MPKQLARRWLQARKDVDNLSPALLVFDTLLERIQSGRGMVFYPAQQRVVMETHHWGLDLGPVSDILYFEFQVDARPQLFYTAPRLIHVSTLATMEEDSYKKVVLRTVQRYRREILHELTHHLDYHRAKGGDPHAPAKMGTPEYYNSPSEMNAYFQQGASTLTAEYVKIQKDLRPLDPDDPDHQVAVFGLSDLADHTFKTFFDAWVMTVPKFWDALTLQNKRRVSKRVFDLYTQIVLGARRQLKELRAKGDPMAITL